MKTTYETTRKRTSRPHIQPKTFKIRSKRQTGGRFQMSDKLPPTFPEDEITATKDEECRRCHKNPCKCDAGERL